MDRDVVRSSVVRERLLISPLSFWSVGQLSLNLNDTSRTAEGAWKARVELGPKGRLMASVFQQSLMGFLMSRMYSPMTRRAGIKH